jgi:RNA polymerase sigma-70 factor (ECF subfamily)
MDKVMNDKGVGPRDEPGGPPPPPAFDGVSTLDLLERARSGDERALEELCGRYLPRLRRWATGRLPRHARGLLDTDDLVQDSLLRTVRRLDSLRAEREGSLQVYLRQVILNRIRDAARRPRVVQSMPDEGLPQGVGGVSPLEEVVGRETLERYEAALDRLRPEDREAVVARIELGGTYEELAGVLAKPSADAARMAIGRALARLAEEMKGD